MEQQEEQKIEIQEQKVKQIREIQNEQQNVQLTTKKGGHLGDGGNPFKLQQEQDIQVSQRKYSQIVKYTWNHEGDWVNIYIPTDGLTLAKEMIDLHYEKDELDLKINVDEQRAFRLVIQRFRHEINAAESTFRIRKKEIVLKMKKANAKDDLWNVLNLK